MFDNITNFIGKIFIYSFIAGILIFIFYQMFLAIWSIAIMILSVFAVITLYVFGKKVFKTIINDNKN